MKLFRPLTFWCLLWLTDCGSALKAGISAYDESRYPEAMAELDELSEKTRTATPEIRLRYALYRGLTHLALGDARQAEAWLARVQQGDKHLLGASDLGRFDAAWRSLGHMPGDEGSRTAP